MAKPVAIPNTFASQTGNIPLLQLDNNFTTVSTALNDYQTYANYAVDSGAVNAMVITLSPAPTNQASLLGVVLTIQVNVTNTLTPTLNVNAFGAQAVLDQAGNSIPAGYFGAGRIISVVWNGTNYIWQGLISSFALRSYLAGCTLSTAGSSTTMTIGAGTATDSTNAVLMTLASATAKTTAAWAVGTAVGGLDTGSIANSTWYYFYIIRRPDTGVVDAIFSLSASSPTLPTNYTQYRRVGPDFVNGTGQWANFTQVGDDYYWLTVPALDVNASLGTTATTYTLANVPTSIRTLAHINVNFVNAGSAVAGYVYSTDMVDQAISSTVSPLATLVSSAAGAGGYEKIDVYTSSSAQIRAVAGAATSTIKVAVLGWRDITLRG